MHRPSQGPGETSPYMRRQIPWPWPGFPGSPFGPGLTSKTGLGLEREHQIHLFRGRSDSHLAAGGAHWPPRGLQTVPRGLQETSRWPPDGSKRPPDSSKSIPRGLQTAPRAVQETSRWLQEHSKRSPDDSKSTQELSKSTQELSKRPQDLSGSISRGLTDKTRQDKAR